MSGKSNLFYFALEMKEIFKNKMINIEHEQHKNINFYNNQP